MSSSVLNRGDPDCGSFDFNNVSSFITQNKIWCTQERVRGRINQRHRCKVMLIIILLILNRKVYYKSYSFYRQNWLNMLQQCQIVKALDRQINIEVRFMQKCYYQFSFHRLDDDIWQCYYKEDCITTEISK